MTALEPYAQGDRTRLKQLHVLANAPALIPDSFKKGGVVDWGSVALACHAAERLQLDPVANLKQFPVIHGAVFPMAEIWRILARRHGWRVNVPVDTDERVVVTMSNVATGETCPAFELTAVEAQRANTNANKLYDTHTRSMLRARATMAAIRLNAPEVLQDPAAVDWAEISGPAAVAELGDAHDGEIVVSDSTAGPEPITPPRRPVTDAARVRLIEAIEGLPDATKDDLRRACVDVELPNVMSSDLFNLCDAALLERLITEALARAEMYAYTEEEMAPFEP